MIWCNWDIWKFKIFIHCSCIFSDHYFHLYISKWLFINVNIFLYEVFNFPGTYKEYFSNNCYLCWLNSCQILKQRQTQSKFTCPKSNTRKRCEKCSKLTIKTPERRYCRHWRRSAVFIVSFEHISHLSPLPLLLTLNK